MNTPESRAARAHQQISVMAPRIRPPSEPVPFETRIGWAVQAAAVAERGARCGDLLTASVLHALSARQSMLARRPAAEMTVAV